MCIRDRGNPADLPAPLTFPDGKSWRIGTPDLIVKSAPVEMKAQQPDWFGSIGQTPTGLTEDRYVAAVEVKEVNDSGPRSGRSSTVGGLYLFHHAAYAIVGGFVGRVPVSTSPRERHRFEVAPRSRLQVPSARIQTDIELPAVVRGQRPGPGHQGERGQPAGGRVLHAAAAGEDQHLRAAHARARRSHVPRGDLGRERADAQLLQIRSQLGTRVLVRRRRGADPSEGNDPARRRVLRYNGREQE